MWMEGCDCVPIKLYSQKQVTGPVCWSWIHSINSVISVLVTLAFDTQSQVFKTHKTLFSLSPGSCIRKSRHLRYLLLYLWFTKVSWKVRTRNLTIYSLRFYPLSPEICYLSGSRGDPGIMHRRKKILDISNFISWWHVYLCKVTSVMSHSVTLWTVAC